MEVCVKFSRCKRVKSYTFDTLIIIFKNTPVYTNLQTLISEAKLPNSYTSLAIFKPTKILNFVIEPDKREWDPEKLESLQAQSRQL